MLCGSAHPRLLEFINIINTFYFLFFIFYFKNINNNLVTDPNKIGLLLPITEDAASNSTFRYPLFSANIHNSTHPFATLTSTKELYFRA